MKQTYLLDVISALTPLELAECLVFLESPYFNRGALSKDVLKLYQIIVATAPEFSEASLDKKNVYPLVFPDKPFVEGKLEKLMAELNRLLRIFAVVNRKVSHASEEHFQLEWIEWLRERGIKDRYMQAVSKFKTHSLATNKESLDQYRMLFLVAESEYTWDATYNMLKGDLNIPKYLFQLDLFYLNLRGDLNIRFLIQRKAAQLPDPENIESFQEFGVLPKFYAQKSQLLELNQAFNKLLEAEKPSVESFQEIVSLLQTKRDQLSEDTNSLYYSHLRNLCTLLIDDGHIELVPMLHGLNITNLEQGYFFTDNRLRFNAYLSLVQIAIRAKEYQWALSFTERYKNQLVGGDSEEFYYKLNLASCLIALGKASEALDQLPETAPSTIYLLLVKRLELKAYYELKSDLLPYKIDSFRKFVERTVPKSVSKNLQTMNLNFAHLLTQLYQSPFKDSKRSEQIVDRIIQKKLIGERAWLLEKARELA